MESERGRAKAWPLIVYILSSGGLSVSALRLLKIFINSNNLHYLHFYWGKGIVSFMFLSLLARALAILFVVPSLKFTYFNPFS